MKGREEKGRGRQRGVERKGQRKEGRGNRREEKEKERRFNLYFCKY